MDKAILKKFAIESRQDLIKKMNDKISSFYINEEFNVIQNEEVYKVFNDRHILHIKTKEEYTNWKLLLKRIDELGVDQVVEESAYTWFNRIVAIRYMEIHDYLPLTKDNQSLGIRVLSSKDNTPDPEILKFTNLANPDLDIDFKKEKYVELKTDNEKFKYVLLLVCKKLGKVIPQVFDGVTDYIDILIPDNLLNDTGFVNKIIKEVPEDNFNEVEIIGWLYQYYNQTEKDRVISAKKAYKKNEIPYATQLFTPDWIVKYMVENSLGRYYVEHNGDGGLYVSDDLYPSDNLFPSSPITENWKYFIKDNIKKENNRVSPTDIKCIDPCCGSGHILVYMFEVLYQIYENEGYNKAEIPELILNNNLFGLDIDDRAGQLSVLSVLLKAREYDKNIFNKDIVRNLNVMSIQESSNIDSLVQNVDLSEDSRKLLNYLNASFKDAKEIGSLLIVENKGYTQLIKELENDNTIFSLELRKKVIPLIKQANILSSKYDIVDTNPPYMNSAYMSNKLKKYINKNYYDTKSDMFAAFIKKNIDLSKSQSYLGFMTPFVWLFIATYTNLRKYVLDNLSFNSLIQLEYSAFQEATVPICTFILNKRKTEGIFIKLSEYTGGMEIQKNKYLECIQREDWFVKNSDEFLNIPNYEIIYWIGLNAIKNFSKNDINKHINPRIGLVTGDTDRFIRNWNEVENNNIKFNCNSNEESIKSKIRWFPYQKGGDYRKWYGNNNYIINWENDGYELKNANFVKETGRVKSHNYNGEFGFKEAITWTKISSSNSAFRYVTNGFLYDDAGPICSTSQDERELILALLNSKVGEFYLKILNPTLNLTPGNLLTVPFLDKVLLQKEVVNKLAFQNINISKEDWDSFETSWDFEKHPLISEANWTPQMIANEEGNGFMVCDNMEESYNHLVRTCEERFNNLKKNEEEVNKIFINIYGLQDELKLEESDKDVTVHKIFDSKEDIPEEMKNSQYALTKLDVIKSFISYAVGCMFGRYSLDKDGLIFAGGDFDRTFEKYPGQVLVDDNGQPLPGNQGGWAGVSLANYKYIRYDDKDIKLSYSPDLDNIIPITENKYFEDDIVTKFVKFVEVVYGKNTLEENLDFIANTLGKRTAETSRDTIRRYFLNDFYADHVKMYQKRPIYWLFDSGKKNGFKALIYMHRYNDQTVSKIRLDYLHKMQQTYATELKDVEYKLSNDLSLSDKKELTKKQADLNAKLQETNEYDEKIAHIADQRISIDLDDGVAVNYGKFSVKNPKTGKDESILANSKEIVKKTKNSKEE